MQRFLGYLLNVRDSEWPRVIMLYLMGVFFLTGMTYGETIAEASFLSQVGVGVLPYIFVADAIISIIAIAIYTLFVDRVANQRLLMGILFIAAIAITFGRILIAGEQTNIAYPFLYLLSRVVKDTFNLHFWTYTTSFYDARAAKRIVPLLTTSSRVAGIIAGLTIPPLVTLLLPANMIILWAISLLMVALLAWLMPRLVNDGVRSDQGRVVSARAATPGIGGYVHNLREGYQYVVQSSFLRWMALSTLVLMILFSLLTYQTSRIMLLQLKSVDAMAIFISNLTAITNLIMLPIQLFVLSRLVNRLGLGNSNLIFPAGTFAISGLLIAFPTNLAVAGLAYFDRTTFRTTFRNLIDNLLYNAVPLRVKGRARAFISGLVVPIGSLLGGGLLLILPTLSDTTEFLPITIGILAFIYLGTAIVIRRQYSLALVKMLEQEDFSFLLSSTADISVTDAATFNWLRNKIDESTNAEFTLFMARLISEIGGEESVPILIQIAKTGNSQIRAAIVDILVAADLRSDQVRGLLTELLNDPDPRVRQSAITGLRQWVDQGSERFLALSLDLLRDPELDVSIQVIPALLRSGDAFYVASAMRRLTPIWISNDPHWQARGINVLGQAEDVRFIHNLVDYLNDPNDEVRLAAATSIENLSKDNMPKWIAELLSQHIDSMLKDPIERIRRAGLGILGRIQPPEAQQKLISFLTDDSVAIRESVIEALVRLGKPIIPVLTEKVESSDPLMRKMVTVTLGRITPERSVDLIRTYIQSNLNAIYANHVRLAALSPCANDFDGIDILQSLLRERNQQLIDEIFYLLAAVNDQRAVKVINESIQSDTPRIRANALEAVEALTTPNIARLIGPLFDPEVKPEQLVAVGKELVGIRDNAAEVMSQLLTDRNDIWLRTISSFAVGELWTTLYGMKPATKAESFTDTIQVSVRKARSLTLTDLNPTPAVTDPSAPKKEKDSKRSRSRGLPTDLLNALTGRSEEKKDETHPQPPQPADPCEARFSRDTLRHLLDIAAEDPVTEVKLAAQAASHTLVHANITQLIQRQEGIMLSAIEKIIFLKEVSFFEGMTIDQLKILASVCEEELFTEDTLIFKEGDPGGVLYVVVRGKVGIEVEGQRKGSTARIATIDAYSYFGENRLFDNSPRAERAIALQDTLTLRLRHEPVVALTRQYPDLSLRLINVLSQRLREANDRIVQLTASKPRELHKLYDKLE